MVGGIAMLDRSSAIVQRPSREAKGFIGIASRFRRTRPLIENEAQKMWGALLRELPRFLKGATCGRTVGLHA